MFSTECHRLSEVQDRPQRWKSFFLLVAGAGQIDFDALKSLEKNCLFCFY
jgi:hypothetical protein